MPVAINDTRPTSSASPSAPAGNNGNGGGSGSNGGGGGGGTNSATNNNTNNNGTTTTTSANASAGGVNMNAASPAPARVAPTATSRRGGRSRSPVSAVAAGGRIPPTATTTSAAAPGANDNSTSGGGSNAQPASAAVAAAASSTSDNPANPSSAAAAAAAAAKAYSTSRGQHHQQQQHRGPPPPPPWHHQSEGPPPPPGEEQGGAFYRPPPPPPPPGYEKYPPPQQGWPPNSRDPYHPHPHQHPRGPPPPPRYGYEPRGYGGREPPPPPPPPHEYDRRYARYEDGSRGRYGGPRPMDGRQPYPPPPQDYRYHQHRGPPPQQQQPPPEQQQHPNHRQRYHHRDQPPSSSTHRRESSSRPTSTQPSQQEPPPQPHHQPPPSDPERDRQRGSTSAGSNNGGTTFILTGGATPIHLPKSPVISSKSRRSGTSAASVFRGRPEDTATAPAAGKKKPEDDDDDEDSPQKILLSLRTPTSSFEDKSKKSSKNASPNISDPGALQSSKESSPGPIFGPQRSGEGSKTDSIGMAPSFNLFNQSFDSFGDAQYFNVDSSLQADSFGLGRTESVGGGGATAAAAAAAATAGGAAANEGSEATQVLRNNSAGNFSAQFLAPSGSLTIGYSPVNSFGNASAAAAPRAARGGNVIVVGGQDARSTSPTQVLGMYRSYSGGDGARPLDDSHLRMSVGSFGGQSMGYSRPYDGLASSPSNYYSQGPYRPTSGSDRMLPFYVVLRKFKDAFRDCAFLLPGLKEALERGASPGKDSEPSKPGEGPPKEGQGWDPSVSFGPGSGPHPYSSPPHDMYGEPTEQDIAIAKRRVESSICAFGGNLNRNRVRQPKDSRDAIFRTKEKSEEGSDPPATSSSPETSTTEEAPRKRSKYDEELPKRYYENESRLSWEFEENPPVELPDKDDNEADRAESGSMGIKSEQEGREGKSDHLDDDEYCKPVSSETDTVTSNDKKGDGSSQAKMRYRCKLCGQPKQNHRCPYQQSLARSIGAMVFPAVNAFTADEPGTIAAPLSEMNNFVDIQKDPNESSPSRPTPERMRRTMGTSAQVTPESMRSNPPPVRSSSSRSSRNRKRMYSQMKGSSTDQGDLLFVESMELKPEQFKVVSSLKTKKHDRNFFYPALPLPYAQRKRLSDNLYSLSNEVPKLTDECAQVLREAREKDMWDLAVAELMTQVIVIIHCPDRDYRFEGLRQYLLTLGIAC